MKKIYLILTAILLLAAPVYADTFLDGVEQSGGVAATETVAGISERCTDAEMTTGTKTDCDVTPANAKVELDKKAPASGIALTALANQAAYTINGNATAGAAAPTAIASSADILAFLGAATDAAAMTELGTWGVSGAITDEQLMCAETTGGTNLLKSCGAKITYTEPAGSQTLCRTGAATTGACTNPVKLASFAWDGGGSAVATASSKRCTVLPGAAVITGVYAMADASTTSHFHVYQDAFAAGARSTTVTGAVDISATLGSVDTTLTSWDTSITAGDEICISVEANDNAVWLNVVIYGTL
jgi:hypothetical protein